MRAYVLRGQRLDELLMRYWRDICCSVCLFPAILAGGLTAYGQSADGPAVLPPPGSNLPAPHIEIHPVEPALGPSLVESSSEASLPIPGDGDSTDEEVDPGGLDEPSDNLLPSAPPTWLEPAYWFGPAPWDLGVELGINGSDGTSKTFSLRTGGHIKRKTDQWKVDSSIAYYKTTSDHRESQNDAKCDARLDRLLDESPWTLFFLSNMLYDEFQAFDLRLAINEGVGYQFIDTDETQLMGRFGAGASREFDGPDEYWAQEALFGLEYDHRISRTQRLTSKIDYFPEWEYFHRYRVVLDVSWEIQLDRPRNTSLQFSLLDRYDSTPNGAIPNNLNYGVLLVWGL